MSERPSAGSGAVEPAPGYSGNVTVETAWDILKTEPKATLVDVRTQAEWAYVGVPVLEELGKRTVFVEWQSYPAMTQNPSFAEEIAAAGIDRDTPLLFICRSGARSASAAAAMTALGYKTCYNVSGGFEGPHDDHKHRGVRDGWKARGLPWAQG